MIYVTRKMHFSASHRLYNPTFEPEKNNLIFDKCNNLNGHGHNYTLEVTVKGIPDPETGYVIDLKYLRDLIDEHIVDKVDHKHVSFWRILDPQIVQGKLHSIKLFESDQNFVEYFGDPVIIPIYTHVESN